MLFVFIYAYWYSTWCSYHTIVASFNSNKTGVTSGAGTAYPSREHGFTPVLSGVRVAQSLIFCRSLFDHFSLFLCPLDCLSIFWFTSSHYHICVSWNFSGSNQLLSWKVKNVQNYCIYNKYIYVVNIFCFNWDEVNLIILPICGIK